MGSEGIHEGKGFTHLNKEGMPRMVDIANKIPCKRKARACASIVLNSDIVSLCNGNEIHAPKGAVFHTAILAGIQAVKQTYQLVPLCHPIPISACDIDMALQGDTVYIECVVSSQYATGVEMEAITGATMAAITVYDMCKGINSNMTITDVTLIEKIKE